MIAFETFRRIDKAVIIIIVEQVKNRKTYSHRGEQIVEFEVEKETGYGGQFNSVQSYAVKGGLKAKGVTERLKTGKPG